MVLSIKSKLIIGLSFAIIAFITIAMVGYTNLGQVNDKLNLIAEVSGKKLKLAARINQDVLNTSRSVKDLILAKTQDEMDQSDKYIETIQEGMAERITALTPLLTDDGADEFKQFSDIWAAYLKQQQQIISLTRKNSNKKATEISLNQARKLYDMAAIQIKAIVDSQEAEQADTVEGLQEIVLKTRLAARINRNLVEIQRAEKNLILSTKEAEMLEYAQFSESKQEDMLTRIEQLLELVSLENKQRLILFKERLRQYISLHQKITELTQDNSNNKAITLTLSIVRDQKIKKATSLIALIVERAETQMQKDKIESDELFEGFKTLWITIIALALLLLGGVFYWIIFGITNSINALKILVTNLSKGNLKTTNITLNEDEIGEVYADSIVMQQSLVDMSGVVSAIAEGDVSSRVVIRGDEDLLAHSINKMADNIANVNHLNQQQQWLQQSLIELANSIQQVDSVQELATSSITQFCHNLDAKIGAIYFIDTDNRESQSFKLLGSYAFTWRKNLSNAYKMGEGLVGQAALEQRSIILQNTPDDYIKIESALGEMPPRNIIVVPIILQDRTLGVIEIGFTDTVNKNQQEYIERGQVMLAIAFDGIKAKVELSQALKDAQTLTEELQAQQDNISATNEELTAKSEALQEQSTQLRKAQKISEERSVAVETSNQYKSEFLANMSHELRTPLNSLLILAGMLAKNKEGTLTEDQVDSAQIIKNSGEHLLQLINDILDLSKVEAGHMEVTIAPTQIPLLKQSLQQRFNPLAKEKSLDFNIVTVSDLPATLKTDAQKLEQVLTNLISNAIKFTSQGEVRLEISYQQQPELFPENAACLCFSVIDNGIGIARQQQEKIFGAFQQIDGSSSRKEGGTGLGLSIALAYAHLLGGHLKCQSELGKGSQFDLYIPEHPPVNQITTYQSSKSSTDTEQVKIISNKPVSPAPFHDDRNDIVADDLVVLILEDDIEFAKILYREAKEKGFKCIVSDDAESSLQLALQHQVSGILLDFCLPDMDGKTFLDKMKRIPAIRYIPVHVISALQDTKDYWQQGVVGYLTKPVSQTQIVEALNCLKQFSPSAIRHLLIVEDDKNTQQALHKLLSNENVDIHTVNTVKGALQSLKTEHYDGLILDIGLPDGSGFDLLAAIEQESSLTVPPLIVYTNKDLSVDDTQQLRQYTDSIIIKSEHSTERLKDEAALFLHQAKEKKHEPVLEGELLAEFNNKTLLLVDDDMRNSLALRKALQELGIKVIMAASGQGALNKLAENNAFNLVIMDIMMPEMDGYETMRRIRAQDQFTHLPIIAITAKAMKGDKEKCLQAGANDYLSKPIDMDKLTQLIHLWMNK